MKKSIQLIAAILLFNISMHAQVSLQSVENDKTYIISTHDNAEFIGKIISHDMKEVIIKTNNLGEVSVPTYQIKELEELKDGDLTSNGDYLKDNLFATRYFITSNGLDIKKGDAYALLNWYGPDIQYGIADNLSVGIMSSWIGSPVIATMKYSFKINEKNSVGVGALAGTLGWAGFQVGGALPFVSYTVGDRKTNLTASAGYGAMWQEGLGREINGAALVSFAGMSRVTNNLSLVFDSFIAPGFGAEKLTTAIVIPGIRFQRKEGFALQLGFAGVISESYNWYDETTDFSTFALPMGQLFFKF